MNTVGVLLSSVPSMPSQADLRALLDLLSLVANPAASSERVAAFAKAADELRTLIAEATAAQAELDANRTAHEQALQAARAEHDAVLAREQQESAARRLQAETAIATRDKRLAEMEAKVVAAAEANEQRAADLERRLGLLQAAASAA
jgi:hypothetical protein